MNDLSAWWRFREESLSQEWNLGLERVAGVAQSGGLAPQFPLITVAGTNGKGSICRFMEAIAVESGLRVGVYSSPHLFRFNERIRLQGKSISDGPLADAFAEVAALPEVSTLTVYEYDTLVAMAAFRAAGLDLVILEVGLGGRLDAVNIWDADLAVIACVDLDHQQWLGDTREKIGLEKAGIMRPGKPVVIGDRNPPQSVLERAATLGAPLERLGEEFDWQARDESWTWRGPENASFLLGTMAMPADFQRDNASTAIAAIGQIFPIEESVLRGAVATASLPGRCQRLDGDVPIWFEVGHNPQAVSNLVRELAAKPVNGRTLAVFAALEDKDIETIVSVMREQVAQWYLPQLDDGRACSLENLKARVLSSGVLAQGVVTCDNTALAFTAARAEARPGDQIIVFGSFLTVAEALGEMPLDASLGVVHE